MPRELFENAKMRLKEELEDKLKWASHSCRTKKTITPKDRISEMEAFFECRRLEKLKELKKEFEQEYPN